MPLVWPVPLMWSVPLMCTVLLVACAIGVACATDVAIAIDVYCAANGMYHWCDLKLQGTSHRLPASGIMPTVAWQTL